MIYEGTRVFCRNIFLVLKSIFTSLILSLSWFDSDLDTGLQRGRSWKSWKEQAVRGGAVSKVVEIDHDENCDDVDDIDDDGEGDVEDVALEEDPM